MNQTQNQRILQEMRRGIHLTTLDCAHHLCITNLPKRVCELKAAGHLIQDQKVKRNGKTFKEYYL